MSVSIEEFRKAVTSLEKALAAEETDLNRDASIQRFEFCVELAWKCAKKQMGTSTTAPKQVIREMAQNGLIQDIDIWLSAIDHRNLSSHTYNEDLAKKVYSFAKGFHQHVGKLLNKLDSK